MNTDDALLAGFTLWLLKVAWDYADDPADVQDLTQEGHIAMWRALRSYDPACGVPLPTHLMNKARWRMADVAARGTFTGKPSQAGKKHSAGTRANRNRELATDTTTSDHDVPVEPDLDAVITAYHHGEIMAAVNSLPLHQRKKVYDRFWRGVYDPRNGSWWYGRGYGARDRLRVLLEHLRGLSSG